MVGLRKMTTGKLYKYVCVTSHQTNTECNPGSNPNSATKQHATVSLPLYVNSLRPLAERQCDSYNLK